MNNLINEVSTRFNSSYKMVERIFKLSSQINEALQQAKKKDLMLNIENELEDISKLYSPFDDLTVVFTQQ
jgi:ATP phosphoribosyltransferase